MLIFSKCKFPLARKKTFTCENAVSMRSHEKTLSIPWWASHKEIIELGKKSTILQVPTNIASSHNCRANTVLKLEKNKKTHFYNEFTSKNSY